jgi:hypothetical protein
VYQFTKNNLLKMPNTYQFSDVSSDSFLIDYKIQREKFIKHISSKVIKDYDLVVNCIKPLSKDNILKLQKKFEVNKKFFEDYKANVNFLSLLSFHIANFCDENFCYSLFSTLLKINDTLTSLDICDFSYLDIFLINHSLKIELKHFDRIYNEI